MPRSSQVVCAMALAGAMGSPAAAAFTHIALVHHADVTTPVGPRSVYRLYAYFSAPDDRLWGWGDMEIGQAQIFTGPCPSMPGSAFFNPAIGGNTAPWQVQIDKVPSAEWDTFATIGVSIGDQGVPTDFTSLTLGFPIFILGNSVTLDNQAVAAPGVAAQTRADFAGDGDLELRVLMAQLTTMPGEHPYGIIGEVWWGSNGAGSPSVATNQSWIGLAAHGRCCVPDGTCIVTYHANCELFANGFFIGCGECAECEGTCVADVAPHPGDGEVNIDDLLAVVGAWGPCPALPVCPPDVAPAPSGNDVVDIDDLLAVISAWGPCP